MPLIVIDDGIGHVLGFASDRNLVGLIATCSENRPSVGENPGKHLTFQFHSSVLGQPAKSVFKTNKAHVKGAYSGPGDTADRGIQSGAITPAGQNSNMFSHSSSSEYHVRSGLTQSKGKFFAGTLYDERHSVGVWPVC